MPSRAMQDAIDALRERHKAGAGQAPPTLEQRRAGFVPGDRLHPVPDDVLVTEVTAGGVPGHWLAAPGADPGRVLLFLHGGGYRACPASTSSRSAPRGSPGHRADRNVPAGPGSLTRQPGWLDADKGWVQLADAAGVHGR
jgi:hypothetical protein